MPTHPKYRVLMVCTGNICRSPMAAFLLPERLPREIKALVRVESAGTHALHGNPAEPLAVEAMAGRSIDLESHRARRLNREMVRRHDLVLTMELYHREIARGMLLWNKSKVRLLSDFNPGSREPEIADPYGGPLSAYHACLDTLTPCIAGVAAWIAEQLGKQN